MKSAQNESTTKKKKMKNATAIKARTKRNENYEEAGASFKKKKKTE